MKEKSVHPVVLVLLVLAFTAGCPPLSPEATDSLFGAISGEQVQLSTIVEGLKEALKVGTESTVSLTSSLDGYFKNDLIKIPLPEKLQKPADTLRAIGFGSQVDQLVTKMNRAAERAAAVAAPVFVEAISQMTFSDAKQILYGSSTEATDYFRRVTEATLKQQYTPIIEQKMSELEVVRMYSQIIGNYNSIPFVQKVDFNITEYVTDNALDGLFRVLGQEEAKIRANPAARTKDIIKKVFALQDNS